MATPVLREDYLSVRYGELEGIYRTFPVSIRSVREGNLLRKGKVLYRGTEQNAEMMHSVWEKWGCSKDLDEGRLCMCLGVALKVTKSIEWFYMEMNDILIGGKHPVMGRGND